MITSRKLAAVWGAASVALLAFVGRGLRRRRTEQYAAPPPPADEGRKFTYSFNLAGTSDYVFRGISQTDNDPAVQGGIDLGYGILYARRLGLGHRFRHVFSELMLAGRDRLVRRHHADVGPANFDFGAHLLHLSGRQLVAPFTGPDLNYLELKAGASGELHKNLTAGLHRLLVARLLRRDRQRLDGRRQRGLDAFHKVAHVHAQHHRRRRLSDRRQRTDDLAFNGYEQLLVLERGPRAAVDNITFDFRYWGTNASNAVSDTLTCINSYCDGRFVFTAKVAVP